MVPSSKSSTRTLRYVGLSLNALEPDACALFAADSTEPRGHLTAWQDLYQHAPGRCTRITVQRADTLEVSIRGEQPQVISLRDDEALKRVVAQRENERLYLDISGLGHHVWAPLLRVALNRPAVNVVYAEPLSYTVHPSPSSPQMFDLSSAITGVAPIPGMARLSTRIDQTDSVLVAFLGFEGNRAQHVALSLDSVAKVVPVIGVPGFRMEYPAYAVASNRAFLDEYQCHAEIRYARASCPFEAYDVLSQLRTDYASHYFYVAPLGTKPHALGAIQYAITHPAFTEVVYDHPVRKPGRTKGVGVVHVYRMT